ncbi:hypothetical protein E4U43_008460 [Claviceps pusilla]|uniref:Protein ZIP4 homolog n=1 Tax=Claviceps pusilla TaxID=123648 RepID=A0A9P7NB52_9HYPO|nr:hypothetical protein E4U43_008460 [Claviceps pusilla]
MKDHPSCTVKNVDDVVDLLGSLQVQLANNPFDHAKLETLFATLPSAIHLVNLWLTKPSTLDDWTRPKDLEVQCHTLWNTCIRSRSTLDSQNCQENRSRENTGFMSVWLLSFLCLELSRLCFYKSSDQARQATMSMKLMVPIVKASINEMNFETARLALQRGAAHLDNLKLAAAQGEKGLPQDRSPLNLQAKYYAMRIWLSWQEDCPDVAEHMYSKTDALHEFLDVDSAEFLADMIQRVGSALISRNTIDLGLTWLQRAYSILRSRAEKLTTQGRNLYLAICNDLISCLCPGSLFENLEEAEAIIQQTQPVLGDNPIWCHWRLRANEFEHNDGICDEKQYSEALKGLILNAESQENMFFLVWTHVKNIRRRSPARAAKLLTQLLLQPDLNAPCIGRVLFLRISIMSDKTTRDEECEDIAGVINRIEEQIPTSTIPPLTLELCHSLIWNMTKTASTLEQFDLVQFWCELALRPLFRCTAIRGIDRFFRKLLLCGMRRNELHIHDYETDVVPSFCGDDVSLTHYLSFKAASLSWDRELGCKSLRKLASTTDVHKGQELLYASLSRVGLGPDRELILSILQYLLESCFGPGAETVNLPLLLRCTIRVLRMAEQDESEKIQGMNDANLASHTCSLFEMAAKYAVHDAANAMANRRFTIQDLDWFHHNSYNLGVLRSSDWESHFSIRILNACLTFATCYPTDIAVSQTKAAELALTTLRCHFVISASLLKQARIDDDAPSRLQHYRVLRRHITEFGTTLHNTSLSFDAHTHHDLKIKYTTLLVYDFEAAISLSQFAVLRSMIDWQRPLGNVEAYKAMGDILLQSSTPAEKQVFLDMLKRIVNEIFALEVFDAVKLAKYLRCLFHVLLPKNDAVALGVLDHLIQVSLESKAVGTPLPTVQLEWFVARAFNHALDHYVQFQEESCRIWASKAMELAQSTQDGGVLAETLQARFEQLRFQSGMTLSTE